ncbi:hypothetical protein [Acutalibacter muris]|jgi:hypothetical protein|uniref:hypothetical protein n=1 Tax=Acutalibacter muris TaxID=1796620 RepID=UPI00272E5250|nr:hypothetical protein [Acutalibacter muris]
MLEFENVDIISTLGTIMRQSTVFYRSDFEVDKQIIQEAAISDDAEDKYLLWMCRPSGTWCFREREAFIQGTSPFNTWKFYGEQTHDHILAYAVELNASRRRKVRGTVYELNYWQHFQHARATAQRPSVNRLTYEGGFRDIPPDAPFDCYPDHKLGALLRYDILPQNPAALEAILVQERRRREQEAVQGDFKVYCATLTDQRQKMTPQLALAGW